MKDKAEGDVLFKVILEYTLHWGQRIKFSFMGGVFAQWAMPLVPDVASFTCLIATVLRPVCAVSNNNINNNEWIKTNVHILPSVYCLQGDECLQNGPLYASPVCCELNKCSLHLHTQGQLRGVCSGPPFHLPIRLSWRSVSGILQKAECQCSPESIKGKYFNFLIHAILSSSCPDS